MALTDTWWDKIVSGTDKVANAIGIKDSAGQQRTEDLSAITEDEINQIPLPVLEQITLENPDWLSDLKVESQGRSELDNIQVDPRLEQAQMRALDSLEGISDGGLNNTDKANLARIEAQAASADRGRRGAILQNMQMRGMGGSGNELLAQLQSSQDATNQQSQRGLDVAGMGQQRALDAMIQSGQLAGNIRGQGFSEQARVGDANDSINRFNTSNTNQAAEYNNAGRQGVETQRANTANQQTMYNANIPQQNFDNSMAHVAAKGGARGQQIGVIGANSKSNTDGAANAWGGAAKLATKYFKDKKDDNEDEE